ncbi:heme-dependent oxidative N-demethylase family protein [Allosediminivita pacifica]|uniref:Uncharacterized protein DUF3445 n=1 Tax=Allosediminivita pacifica TaxID=1267769 RepID=A0A2T6AST0_9RHOB|nr:DUF3445 domain-containing protein [Allosediminivita pacifica]PTX46884.1 uncharacterized protein DUF3445 [Allosediminivita pacifica]GGB15491.1 hypothetical protein GCM10011324_27110 [Allosediminivita pacifica]
MILQSRLPYDIDAARKLPGIAPLDPADWLMVDEAFADQMALRETLLRDRRDDVLRLDPAAMPAALELLDTVIAALPEDFHATDTAITRPDCARVTLDRTDPMGTLGHLVQEDLCLLEKRGEEHVLTGAVLCFPASWTLSEKVLKPLTAIHVPVPEYDADIARRVQRLFDGVKPGRPLWRFNALRYDDPSLHHPRTESAPKALDHPDDAPFLRSERQCILRLPQTGAVVFSIHTFVVRVSDA